MDAAKVEQAAADAALLVQDKLAEAAEKFEEIYEEFLKLIQLLKSLY